MSEGVYRALLIGNSTFPEDPHNLFDLNGPFNDLALLRQALVDPTSGLFAPSNVRLLAERTKGEITRAVEGFFRSAGFDDTLLLYYSGHGKSDESDNLFLCGRDTSTDLLVSSGISDVEIDGMMRRSSARRFVLILDCCHSGAFKSGGLPMNLKGTGRFLLTSSRRGESSRDADDPHETSAFTRHLVDALRAGADRDGDGYVSVSEVYEHVLQALRRETKQIPQRQFDRTIGDIALARATRKAAAAPRPAPTIVPKPVLAVSPPVIELRDIGPDEELPAEIIDVYNDGEGALDWSAKSNVDWIDVVQHDTYCELRLRPRPGVNRGNVHIWDAGRGGSRTVRVLVEVRESDFSASIEVTPMKLDYGVLTRNSESPSRTLLIKKSATGDDATASADAPWVRVEQKGDVVSVSIDTGTAGELSAHVVVRSTAGDRVIPVQAIVEEGPMLKVKPTTIEFGRPTPGRIEQATISVTNGGSGELEWRHRKKGSFFSTKRGADTLTVTLVERPGNHLGSIAIHSNGGNAAVEVRARVPPKRKEPQAPKMTSGATPAATKPAFGASLGLKKGERILWRGMASSCKVPGRLRGVEERLTANRPHVVVTNKRLILAHSYAPPPTTWASIRWSEFKRVRCVDDTRPKSILGPWHRKERALVFVDFTWGSPTQFLLIETDSVADAQMIADQIAAPARLDVSFRSAWG
jgi:hypothetical protein